MQSSPLLRAILARYAPDCRPERVEPLGSAGGFSGALFWRLHTPRGALCLRRWPKEHPSPERLELIHQVLRRCERCGLQFVPVPILAEDGSSFVSEGGHFWELSPWMPGAPHDFALPSLPRLDAALEALAEFHLAAASFPGSAGSRAAGAPSPAIMERLRRIERLLAGDLRSLQASITPAVWPAGADRGRRLIELFSACAPEVAGRLQHVVELRVPLLPCLRDIWSDHVLFSGSRVTGIIDFGALRIDSPAADIARLLGSTAGDDPNGWSRGLAAYGRLRPLEPSEAALLQPLDQSGVLLSGLNWIDWIYRQRRQFDNLQAIAGRLDCQIMRLEQLARGKI